MTPLAAKVARDLTVPTKDRRFDDRANVLDLFEKDMHCFEVSAIARSVNDVLDGPIGEQDVDLAWNVWRDVESMLPRTFLPSPVTWLESTFNGSRIGCVLHKDGDYFSLETVFDSASGPFSIHMCDFRARSILEAGERIEVIQGDLAEDEPALQKSVVNVSKLIEGVDPSSPNPAQLRKLHAARDLLDARVRAVEREAEIATSTLQVLQTANRFIGMAVLTLNLINTPGLIGLKQHAPHRSLARKFQTIGAGRYPLHAWSEVVLKHQTRIAGPDEQLAGLTHHKCLHFVRSHLRHYRDGKVVTIPAHWRGDPALGIKRTRYRMAA